MRVEVRTIEELILAIYKEEIEVITILKIRLKEDLLTLHNIIKLMISIHLPSN